MPKVTEEHLEARRAQILEGARHAFAKYGYDGATVPRLEEAIGLSRGAIFHYFDGKLDLFVSVAADVNRQVIAVIRESGIAGALREIARTDPEFLAVLIETESRLRHDEDFVRRMEALADELLPEVFKWWEEQQEVGALRTDIELPQLAQFASLVTNGLAMRVAGGDPADLDIEVVVRLLEDALGPRPQ